MTNPSIQDSQASIAGEPAVLVRTCLSLLMAKLMALIRDTACGDSIPILWKQVWHTTHGLAVEIIPKLAPMET